MAVPRVDPGLIVILRSHSKSWKGNSTNVRVGRCQAHISSTPLFHWDRFFMTCLPVSLSKNI